MLMLNLLLLSLLIQQVICIRNFSHSEKLYADLFTNYNKAVRPVADHNNAILINIHFWFKQILKVDEIDQTMTIYVWLEQYWFDQFLTWDPKDYGNLEILHVPSATIWQPDILVYNGASMNIKESELETNVVLKYTGEIMLFKAVITDIACTLDMTYFPFDQQVCFIMLASWSHDGSKIHLNMRPATNHLDFYISNTEWDLKDFKPHKNLRKYECCPDPFPEILYYFVLERNPSYYILSLIIPSAFITVVTIVGFFTPHSSTGETTEKVSLGVTALLSLAIILLMVSDKMPATSKVMPLIGKYYIGLIFLIFVAACTTTITLNIQLSGNGFKSINPDLKVLLCRMAKFLLISTEGISFDEPTVKKFNTKESSAETAFLIRPPSSYQIVDDNKSTILPPYLNSTYPVNFQRNIRQNSLVQNRRRRGGVTAHINEPTSSDTQETGEQRKIREIFEKIDRNVEEISDQLKTKKRRMKIRREWEFVTRIVERILMIFFIFLMLLFTSITLTTRGASLALSDKVMQKTLSISR